MLRDVKYNSNLLMGVLLLLILAVSFSSAEVVTLSVDKAKYAAGEVATVSGAVLDNDLNALNETNVSIYLDGTLASSVSTGNDGLYTYSITNVSVGNHTVNATTTLSNKIITYEVVGSNSLVSYQIIASSLNVPLSVHNVSMTVKKYQGTTVTTDAYSYSIYYSNGTNVANGTGVSNTAKTIVLPQLADYYTIIIDNQKSFTVSVNSFTLKYKVTDVAGAQKKLFKPNGVAYFEVEGFANGERLTNATVTAQLTDPTGVIKTVTFVETNGVYEGNTNVTQTTPIQLRAGEYTVTYTMKDSSGNEQSITGYFSVLGLDAVVELVEKRPYQAGEVMSFDLTVKDLTDGSLIAHNSTTYLLKLKKNNRYYDTSSINITASSDATKTSTFTYAVAPDLDDGDYYLQVEATSGAKKGKGIAHLEIMNTQIFMDVVDNYDDRRDRFKPGELVKLKFSSDINMTDVLLTVINGSGSIISTKNTSFNSTSGTLSFNVPATSGEYDLEVDLTTDSGSVSLDRWIGVQNYFSFMDTRSVDNQQQFTHASGASFLAVINAFDVTTDESADLTGFLVKFKRIVDEKTGQAYTNFVTVENTTLSDRETGQVVYKVTPPALANGFYRVEYTLVDAKGDTAGGNGFFGVSAFVVNVITKDTNGQAAFDYSTGESINVTINLSIPYNGTATIHREFFDPITFNVSNGTGHTVLKAVNNQLPTQTGFYDFGVEVTTDTALTGLGAGFFEIRNLNFRSITIRSNGVFESGNPIIADLIVEKSGELINGTNVSLVRLFSATDNQERAASATSALTSTLGATTLTITPTTALLPGRYFAEIKATSGNDVAYGGFGFEVQENQISIQITDPDKTFSTTDSIDVSVRATFPNGTARPNAIITIVGLLNLNTWGTISANRQATTSNTGSATITLSAANFNPGTYAPIINISGNSRNVVGFGDGEFTIVPFTSAIGFSGGSESFSLNQTILVDVNVTGSATVTAAVTDEFGGEHEVDAYYTDGVLTINNELLPGEYFVTVTVTQSTSSVSETLWFEILGPWTDFDPLSSVVVGQNDTLNISYTTFTSGAQGWQVANATINISSIENLWSGSSTPVGTLVSANETGSFTFNLTTYNLSQGDYELRIKNPDYPQYDERIYFKVQSNAAVFTTSTVSADNVTINVTATGLSNPTYWLMEYQNFRTFEVTTVGQNQGSNVFTISNLDNGFYQAKVEVRSGTETYTQDVFFDIDVADVTITAPATATVGSTVNFTINATVASNFWIIDPFTQTVKKKLPITPGITTTSYLFNGPAGIYMYGYGDTKWDVFMNADPITITQEGFSVVWPFESNRYLLSQATNFSFNVTSSTANLPMTLKLTNHFSGATTTVSAGNTTGAVQEVSVNLTALNLQNGPHDVQLTLQDGSENPPKENFFIEIFSSQYDIWTWSDQWEYKAGENVTLSIEIRDILNNSQLSNADDVVLSVLRGPVGNDVGGLLNWTNGTNTAKIITSSDWASGNYHAEINVSKAGTVSTYPLDFFLRGNDDLEVFSFQNQWDYASSDTFTLRVEARDNGQAAANTLASLLSLETRPETWNETPVSVLSNLSQAVSFSNAGNLTSSNGSIILSINLSNTSLAVGSYMGQLSVGGKLVWFDFNIRSFQVDGYPANWEYGITDTIELNVHARNIVNGNPIEEDGNVTILRIMKHEPGNWIQEEVPLAAFSVINPYEVANGEALIELQPNQTMLNLTQSYEFEVQLQTDLFSSGSSEGWVWFKLSDTERAQATIVDQTDATPEFFFGGQNYTLKVTGVQSAILQDMWGPQSTTYNEVLENSTGTFTVNFTTPSQPGFYTLQIEVMRSAGYTEYLYEDFQIGSGTSMNAELETSVIPGVNFTISVDLFGEGEDPWCAADPQCNQDWVWYGPLPNKTIVLAGVKDLTTFAYTDLSGLGINATTNDFPSWMLPQFDGGACGIYNDQTTCEANSSCFWDGSACMEDRAEGDRSQASEPGIALFSLKPSTLGLSAGGKYKIIMSYTDDNGDVIEEGVFAQVEQFHVPISKRTDNLAANTAQSVWLKTTDLNGVALPNCSIVFSSMYDAKDYQLIKSLNISNVTNTEGVLLFSYTTPSLPGEYLVEGQATCNVTPLNATQDIAYFIDVSAQTLDVDMKTRFDEDEPIKVSVTTKDRLGQPESQRLELNLFHDRDDYPQPVYSLGGADCTPLDANQNWDHGGFGEANNRIELQTDANGYAELDICPLPRGTYALDLFPIFDFASFNGGPGEQHDDGDFGFFNDFVVSSADITLTNDYAFVPGDNASFNVTALDKDGDQITGNIVAMESFLELIDQNTDVTLHTLNGQVNLTNGSAMLSYIVPSTAENDLGVNQSVGTGPVYVSLMVEDDEGNLYPSDTMRYVLKRTAETSITAPSSVKTNQLILVNVTANNTERYKVEMGVFFLQDNAEKMKEWMIEGGVFLANTSATTSGTIFKILSPREPGSYYLAIPIYRLDTLPQNIGQAVELVIAPIEVTLDLINVTGVVTEDDGTTPIEGLTVRIGKVEGTTDASGQYTLQIPKGRQSVESELKTATGLKQYMKSDSHTFSNNTEVNMSFYRLEINGTLQQTFYNITSPSIDLTTMKLRVNVSVNNTDNEAFSNITLRSLARSGEERKNTTINPKQKKYLFMQNLNPGYETGDYELKLRLSGSGWNSTNYTIINGVPTNTTVGVIQRLEYSVETYAVAGDNIDNDDDCSGFAPFTCASSGEYIDSCIDEETDNNKDDDCDGKIDEDLMGTTYFEWCGNGFCSGDEFVDGSCFEDCATATSYCGDSTCDADEEYNCPSDCAGQVTTCTETNECASDGSSQFCNQWGVYEPAPWCGSTCDSDNCWACGVDGSPGSTQCEAVGCAIESDAWGSWCFKNETCSDNACSACTTSGDCLGTSVCEWETDAYASNGGWCNRPWTCDNECGACMTQSDCNSSSATMDNVSCRWDDDFNNPGNGWCVWDFDFVPPAQGGEGIVNNIWLGATINTTDYQSVVDYKCWSGNCAATIAPGAYYILLHMGQTSVNVSVNGTFVEQITNNNTYWSDFYTALKYNFTNGTWQVRVRDNVGPDDITWTFNIGTTPPPAQPLNVTSVGTTVSGNNVTVSYNLSGTLTGYNSTIIIIDDGSLWNQTRVDGATGILNHTFYNVTPGNHNTTVLLKNHTQATVASDSKNFMVTGSGQLTGLVGNVTGLDPYEGVLVSVYNGGGFVKSIRTDANGDYSLNLTADLYNVEFSLDPSCVANGGACVEEGMVVSANGINVTGLHSLSVMVPNILVSSAINTTPVGMFNEVYQSQDYDLVTLIINNGSVGASGVSSEFNATDVFGHWGGQSVFNDSSGTLLPGANVSLTVPFTPTIPGPRNGSLAIDVMMSLANVLVSNASPTAVEVYVDSTPRFYVQQTYFNVTTNGVPHYLIDGVELQPLNLTRGVEYAFNVNAPGYPFILSNNETGGSTSAEITSGVTNSGAQVGLVTFIPAAGHNNTIYYQSSNQTAMGAMITIVNMTGG